MPRSTSRRPRGSGQLPVRSIRCSDQSWEKARRRANREDVTMSYVSAMLIEGYAEGYIDLPQVDVTYSPTRQPA